MSIFPSLTPSSRVLVQGTAPVSTYAAISGRQRRIRHGNVPTAGETLVMAFDDITEADMLTLRAHALAHRPLRLSFDLSDESILGEEEDWFNDPEFSWIYAADPEIEDIQDDRHSVKLSLSRVPEPAAGEWRIEGLPAAFVTTGKRARLLYSRVLAGSAAEFETTGQAAQLLHDKVITGLPAEFETTGQAAQLLRNRGITGLPAELETTGQPAQLLHDKVITGLPAELETTGQPADLTYP
jgi:hypothetical protein